MNKHIGHQTWCNLLIVIFILSTADCLAQEKDNWNVEDSYRTKGISSLQVSPDDDHLLFVVSRTDLEANERHSAIWRWSTIGGSAERLTGKDGSASSPRWSPSGDKIAYFDSDQNGIGLWVMNADGSGKEKLTTLERSNAYKYYSGNSNKLSWSPDGDQLAFTAAGPRHYEDEITPPELPTGNDVMIIDRMLHKTSYYYSDLRRTHVFTISAKGGEPRKLTSGDFDYYGISWSPDGEYIACVSNQTGRDDYNANNDIMLLPTDGGEAKRLTNTVGPESYVHWGPQGKNIAYHARVRANRTKETDAELHKIFTRSIQSNDKPVNLTGSLDRWAEVFEWSDDGDKIYFTAQNEGRVELYSTPSDGGPYSSIITRKGEVGSFSVTDDGTVYYVYEDITSPDEIYRISSEGGEPKQLTSFNEAIVNEVKMVDAEKFSFNSFDGVRVEGWIMKPAGYERGTEYPLIQNIHGGPHGQDGYGFSSTFQEQAANGYAVLYMNPRGSSGRGQKFSDRVVGDLAGGDYRDIMHGLNYAIGRYEFIDEERMGVTGGSYGGYLTNWVITQTDRFEAAVSVSSISNLITQWSGGNLYLWYESDMGVKPYENYELSWNRSPLKYVQGATTPTLFVHGRWDNVTPYPQATSMYMAMKRMGVDTKIALYPREGHGVRNQPKHSADYHKRALDWFDKYLK